MKSKPVYSLQICFTTPAPPTSLTIKAIKWKGIEALNLYLQAHDIQLEDKGEYFLLTFPEGTLESRRLPVVHEDLLRMHLPDESYIDMIYIGRRGFTVGVDTDAFEAFKEQRQQEV
jgi:hypothetical protein